MTTIIDRKRLCCRRLEIGVYGWSFVHYVVVVWADKKMRSGRLGEKNTFEAGTLVLQIQKKQ